MEKVDCVLPKNNQKNGVLARQALNYALWTFENHRIAGNEFIEKASKTVFELLKCVRNTPAEIHCLFIYWILHEMLFNAHSVDDVRLQAGIENVRYISAHFNIEILDAPDKIAVAK
jgi:hypothetical protein